MPKLRSWSGVQELARPISIAAAKCPIIDLYFRSRLGLWVVWAFIPPMSGDHYEQIILLGAFRDRARARFAADTAMASFRQSTEIVPMMPELLADGGDYLDVMHGISHVADSAPWLCAHRTQGRILSRMSNDDIERLTKQIEDHASKVEDWRFMLLRPPGYHQTLALVRARDQLPIAALFITPDAFGLGKVRFWLDGADHELPCTASGGDNPVLSMHVLRNLETVTSYCDAHLSAKYAADTNAPSMLALLRESSQQESVRQVARVFGTDSLVGLA